MEEEKIITNNEETIEKEDFRDRYLRAVADYQNLKNRVAKERLDMASVIRNEFLKKLIPLYDDIFNSTAFGHHDNDGKKLILKKFQDTLLEFGIETIKDLENTLYDSECEEAISMQFTVEPMKHNKVYKTVKHGFKDANTGKIIEVAKVIVYRYEDK